MTYDKACYNVAMSFLMDSTAKKEDVPILADELAQNIQRVIEDFFAEKDIAD